MDSIIDYLHGLNEESEQLIEKIEHMSVEEEKVYDINDEDMHYDKEDDDLRRTTRENSGIGVERLQPSMDANS